MAVKIASITIGTKRSDLSPCVKSNPRSKSSFNTPLFFPYLTGGRRVVSIPQAVVPMGSE